LLARTTYRYRVQAVDAAGNRGNTSNIVTATPSVLTRDASPPSRPARLTARANPTQIDLTWIASTDNVGVTGYQIERCPRAGCARFALLATTATTGYSNTGLAARTTYRYRVRAMDAAGGKSRYSNVATATTASPPPSPPLPLPPPPSDPLEEALRTGNALLVGNSDIILDAALAAIEQNKMKFNAVKRQLFNLSASGSPHANGTSLTAINWHPTHDAAFLTSTFGVNESVLFTNSVFESGHTVYQKSLAIIGQKTVSSGLASRYMVMGSNPMRNAYRSRDGSAVNDQMHQFMQNSLGWLTGRNDLSTASWNVVIAQTDDSFFFPDDRAIRAWLTQKYGGKAVYNPKDACDGARLSGCITANTRLLIISQALNSGDDATGVATAVKGAMERGIPVLYMHHNGDKKELGSALLPLFDVGYEDDAYWFKLRLTHYDGSKTYNMLPTDVKSIQTLLTHFKNQSFTIRLNTCNEDACSNDAAYHREFQDGASRVRSIVDHYDDAKINIFGSDSQTLRFQKLLILLADYYRQTVAYPMDSATVVTPGQTMAFLKSLFADHVVYHFRTINPAQPDMGNFSRSNFNHVIPVTKTVRLTSKKNFRSAGVYAVPGQTFKVTRVDSSGVKTSVFINTLREGATHLFEARNGSVDSGYNRPKYLKSVPFNIKNGEALTLTSPYGGPIQIGFDTNDQAVAFRFENIGEHPFWDGPEDDSVFAQKLARGDYDWAEFSTSHFEIHSTLLKMRESLQNPNWNTGTKLAAATARYVHNFPHVLAGLQGPGIDVVPEIHDFARQKGWQVDPIDMVKHMNADQATCGYGCSGNPYDAYWTFSPTGHGDIHELGHGLEKDRFRFNGWDLHASTNPYAYYSKTQFYKTTGGDTSCQTLPFKTMFNTLQASAHQTDPFAYMKNANLTDWSNGVGITIQIMMSAQAQGVLQDGWHLLARLHLMEREFDRAKNDRVTWEARRAGLGFGNYSFDAIKTINNNDWLVIAIAYVTGLDYRDYLRMWGFAFSSEAVAQVAGFNYPVVPRKYYISDGKDYCKVLDKPVVRIDGVSAWPLP
jgi:chitodextrinase